MSTLGLETYSRSRSEGHHERKHHGVAGVGKVVDRASRAPLGALVPANLVVDVHLPPKLRPCRTSDGNWTLEYSVHIKCTLGPLNQRRRCRSVYQWTGQSGESAAARTRKVPACTAALPVGGRMEDHRCVAATIYADGLTHRYRFYCCRLG